MLDKLYNSLTVLNEDQLQSATRDQMVTIFNQLNDMKKNLDKELMSISVSLQTKQNEKETLSKEISEKYGVSTIEELDKKKQERINSLAKLGEELKTKINSESETNG